MAVPFNLADVAMQTFLDRGDKRRDFIGGALRFQLHATIRQVLHKARYLELLGDLECLVTKTNALHATCEKHRFKMHFGHRGTGTLCGPSAMINPEFVPFPQCICLKRPYLY